MYLLPDFLARSLVPIAALIAGEAGDGAVTLPGLAPFQAPRFEVVSDEPAVRSGLPSLPEPGDEFFVEEFATFDRARWSEAAGDDGPHPEAAGGAAGGATLKHLESSAGVQGVVVVPTGRGALRGSFDVTRSDALIVTVRARSFAKERPARLRAVQRAGDGAEPAAFETPIAAAATFTETRLVVDRAAGRKRLELFASAGDGPLSIDRIECQWLRPVEREWLLPRHDDATAAPLPASRQRIASTSTDVEMEGCLVPVGGVVRWRTHVPADAPRLDAATTLIGGDLGGCAEWVVEVDEAAVASRRETSQPGQVYNRLTPWVVPLGKFAGRDVVIGLRCAGDRSVVGFAGAPRVLSAAPAEAPPNVVLISLDTLRADRVGPRGGAPSLTPHLDELARRGALFTDACSTSSWTLPAHTSLFSGVHPLAHGVHAIGDRIDPARARLLAERYRDAGYATAAFTSGGMVDPHFGFSRGFERYSVRDPCGMTHEALDLWFSAAGTPRPQCDEDVDATPAPAFDWIRRHADGRFFLFLHTYCVHDYDDDRATTPELQRTALMKRADAGDRAATAELVRRYDASVEEVDRTLVGGVLALLDELALSERTLVVVVSDHGEEFLEHGRFGHALALGHETGAVAMVVAGPGVPAGARIDKPVTLTDVAVTLARLTGLPRDPAWSGQDLFAPPPEEARCRVLVLYNGDAWAEAMWFEHWLVQRQWNLETGAVRFTLEKRNPTTGAITRVVPTEAQRELLERRLDHEIAQRLPDTGDADRDHASLPDALRARLKALGYIER